MAGQVSEPVVLSEEVRNALRSGHGVVALETSVLVQGLPNPRNLQAAATMSGTITGEGAVPAWIAVDKGAVRVGMSLDELEALANDPTTAKVARRDLPVAVSRGEPGATTVSATLWAAHRAGIAVAATGGIGGVHPRSGDVSADLTELARTLGVLVCSGPKSIVDPWATIERLEELGVPIVGYRCDRLPFFFALESDVPLEHRVDTAQEAAAQVRAAIDLGTPSTLLLCNPIPAEHALPAEDVAQAANACEEVADSKGIRGKDLTPFLLSCLAERTGGATLEANLALLESNARLAGEIATTLASGA
jgi:pseudouridylate synthase